MAGYLNRANEWRLFDDAWAEELSAKPSIEYLKMAEANGLRGQFGGWSAGARDEKLRGLTRVIRHFKPLSFEMSISREQFYRLVKLVSPRGLASPHFQCTFGVISIVSRFAAEHRGNVPIDFIFDDQEGVSSDVALFFDEMIRSLPRRARRLINAKPTFRNDIEVLPLQAADMLAWHLRREYETCLSPATLPMADLLRDERGHLMSAFQ